MNTCIDLKEKFGKRYRVRRGEPGDSRAHNPWLLQIDCRAGHIFPWGGDKLAASTNNRGAIAKRLAAMPCVRVVQDGDDGINAIFSVDDFDAVAAVMKPKRRRQLNTDQRDKLAMAGRLALARHRNAGVDSKACKRAPAA